MGMRIRLRRAATIAAVLAGMGLGGSAQAFYFRGWPGDGVPKPPILVTPNAPTDDNPPSARPPEPPGVTPQSPGGPNGPSGTPEPATLALAAVGLGVLAWRKRMRKAK